MKKYGTCEDIEVLVDSKGNWTSKVIERKSSPTESMETLVKKEKECPGVVERAINDNLLVLAEIIIKLTKENKIEELHKDTKTKQLIQSLSIIDMKDLLKEFNLIPMMCNNLFFDLEDKFHIYSFKDRIRVFFQKEYAFTT
jgi:hypothetical protein